VKISEKINIDRQGLIENGPITIVAFGDSVTYGAFASGEVDFETAYWNILKKKINNLRKGIPVNVLNAGIGGVTAKGSLARMDKQVLSHNPDLIIVCFGLNDVNGTLEDYLNSLEEIFFKAQKSGAEVIFMTPNMLNTSVLEDTAEEDYEYAIKTAKMQNEGRVDLYIESAIQLATKMGVKVCDCYKKWKKLSETQDITYLLANRINHPTKKMHELFAESLFETIFEDSNINIESSINTMYEDK